MAARRYLTRTDVARLLDVSPATVARWMREGKLPFVLTLGGQRRYARREILRLTRRLHEPRRSALPGEGAGSGGRRRRDGSRLPTAPTAPTAKDAEGGGQVPAARIVGTTS